VRHRWRHAGDAFPRHHGVRVTLVDARAPAPIAFFDDALLFIS
jgi:hypothetical protein